MMKTRTLFKNGGGTTVRQPGVLLNLEATGLEDFGSVGARCPMVKVFSRKLTRGNASSWEEVGSTESVVNRITPKFIKHFRFDGKQAKDLLLRFEVYATDSMGIKRTLTGITETSLALIVKSEDGVLELELEDEETGEMTGAVLCAMAHEIEPIPQSDVTFDIEWRGVGMIGQLSRVVLLRKIAQTGRYTPIYASEALQRGGKFHPIRLPSYIFAEGLRTTILFTFMDVGSLMRLAVLEAPLDAILSLNLRSKDAVWHDDIHVDVPLGTVTLPRHYTNSREVYIQLNANIPRKEARSPMTDRDREGSMLKSGGSTVSPTGERTPKLLAISRQRSNDKFFKQRTESMNKSGDRTPMFPLAKRGISMQVGTA
eukprot:CAMPEP_0182448216 /NCGR_PEP_ID=MMETSP1172-20130603/24893_1 /TAXON_ID=708627 /ORGANISM="Timspurckia oligopyrenoides, Strain CCMP3278" /LENGTH=369 /DNA_ID=CAMNT_0024644997 /DNA_START=137 /DNA_END=1246 /DNA_ORIENTATION=+